MLIGREWESAVRSSFLIVLPSKLETELSNHNQFICASSFSFFVTVGRKSDLFQFL